MSDATPVEINPGSNGLPSSPRPLPPPVAGTLTGSAQDDLYQMLFVEVPFGGLTIRDPGGVDALSALGIDGSHSIDLHGGAHSSIGIHRVTIASDTRIEAAIGAGQADVLVGNELANWLDGAGGDDTLHGEAGIDTAAFAGAWAQGAGYTLTRGDAGLTVADRTAGRDGTDTLHGIERLAFSDVTVALDVDGPAGMAFRLYQAAFLRRPDESGLGFHIRSLEAGVTLAEVAAQFMASAEFRERYASLADADFVSLLYVNALGRQADAEGHAYHLGTLRSGTHGRADVLVGFSESAENHAQLMGAMQAGMVFTSA